MITTSEQNYPASLFEQTKFLAIGVNKKLKNINAQKFSESEAEWLAQNRNGTSLLNEQATVRAVCDRMSEYDVIHFACHGTFYRTKAMESGLELADNILTTTHILQLSLKASLITLSACDTGLNDIDYGDELWGLTRAFLVAGAHSVLVSLWPVYEVSTRIFMEHFYGKLGEKYSRAQALAAAQHHIRNLKASQLYKILGSEQYGLSSEEIDKEFKKLVKLLKNFSTSSDDPCLFAHPYYWGAFLLIGDYR